MLLLATIILYCYLPQLLSNTGELSHNCGTTGCATISQSCAKFSSQKFESLKILWWCLRYDRGDWTITSARAFASCELAILHSHRNYFRINHIWLNQPRKLQFTPVSSSRVSLLRVSTENIKNFLPKVRRPRIMAWGMRFTVYPVPVK